VGHFRAQVYLSTPFPDGGRVMSLLPGEFHHCFHACKDCRIAGLQFENEALKTTIKKQSDRLQLWAQHADTHVQKDNCGVCAGYASACLMEGA
jgi:hypothetical protein